MKIMVTLDGSDFSEEVVEPAAKLARAANAEVLLVRVLDPHEVRDTISGSGDMEETIREEYGAGILRMPEVSSDIGLPHIVEYSDQSLERITGDARDYLRQVGHRFAPVSVEVVALVGAHVAEELAKVAREHEVDLIAMASHGHTGLARLVLGNHAEQVMRSGVAPVMVVRPDSLRHH